MNPTRATILLTCIFLLGNFAAFAQQKTDTTKPKVPLRIVSFDENNLHYGNKSFNDSVYYSLDSFHVVHPLLINTGNLGSAGHYLLPRYSPGDAFTVRPDAFAYFGFNRFNRKFYNTNLPYTTLQYFVGQKEEQYVNVLHTRNFGDNLNFSFHFTRARAEGFYKRQQTSNTSLRTNLWYMGPAKHYSLMTDVFWTGVNVAENGGLANDSTFTDATQLDRQVNDVNLENAGTVERKRGVWMKHTFSLGNVTDTLVLDSVHTYNVITPAWAIAIVSELYDEKYSYTDADPITGFYDVIYRDSTATNDSTYCWRINNSLRLEKFNQYGARSFRGFVGVRHEAGEYWNDTIYTHFQNIYAEGRIGYVKDSTAAITAHGWYVLSGINQGNFDVHTVASANMFDNKLNFEVDGFVGSQDPAYFFKHYSGNNFRWQNDFHSVIRQGVVVSVFYKGQNWLKSIGTSVYQCGYTDPVYMDDSFLPAQYDGNVAVLTGSFSLDVAFGWFHNQSKVTYANTTNDTVFRIPDLTVQNTMYADMRLFKKALQMQVGVNITWFSEFTAEAYMPAVSQLYPQYSRKVGNYPYFDPWLSIRIKPVRVFVKVEHANAGLMGRKYFNFDHYPHNDMAVKIGLSWMFSD